jgi:hypothetical protein
MKDQADGVDYSTSVTLDPADFEGGTSFSWRYPKNVGRVFGYPHIGYDPNAAGVSSTQDANIVNLSAKFDVALSNTTDSTVGFDIWFNSQPNGPWATTSVELLVEVHPTSRPPVAAGVLERLRAFLGNRSSLVLKGQGFTGATVHISHPSEAGASWTFIDVKMPEDVFSGSVSLSDVIKELIWNGVMTGQEYLTSLQFGSEVLGGTGSLELRNLSYDWTARPNSVSDSGSETIPIAAGGGNHIIGKKAGEAALYPGPYNRYQIKSAGTRVFVIADNDLSTLDTLEGIAFIKFSNGTYNTSTGGFSAASNSGSR